MNLTNEEVLELIPQQEPFRFIDKIHHIDDTTIKASFTFRPDMDFYRGHFPENPVTPGVILIEAAAQMSAVSHGIWLLAKECERKEQINEYTTLFTGLENTEFLKSVLPGDTVFVEGKLLTWKRKRIKHDVIMRNHNNDIIMTCIFSGFGVKFKNG